MSIFNPDDEISDNNDNNDNEDYILKLKNEELNKIALEIENKTLKLNRLNEYCFVKLTVNGTQETSRDIALNKVNELLSIFSLYKPHYCNGFGIMGNVLPLNSQITNYVFDSNDEPETNKPSCIIIIACPYERRNVVLPPWLAPVIKNISLEALSSVLPITLCLD